MVGPRTSLTAAGAFAFLLGEWRLQREIGQAAVADGMLTVTATADGWAHYREQVIVRTTAGVAFRAFQNYTVQRTAAGFALCFSDTGAIFEEVLFACEASGMLRAAATHLCGADRYDSLYELGPGRQFTVQHAVSGPRKEYVSSTMFSAVK